jgi:hypothetical protein
MLASGRPACKSEVHAVTTLSQNKAMYYKEGLRLVSVTFMNGIPPSSLSLRVNYGTI